MKKFQHVLAKIENLRIYTLVSNLRPLPLLSDHQKTCEETWQALYRQYLCPLRQVRELSGEVQQPQHRFSGLRRFSATIVKVRESRVRAAAVAPILRSSSWIRSKIYAPRHSIDCQFLFYQLLERKKAMIYPQLSSTSRVARVTSSTAPIRARQKSTVCAPPAPSLRSGTSSS